MNAAQISEILKLPITDELFEVIPEPSRQMLILQAKTRAELAERWMSDVPKAVLLKTLLRNAGLSDNATIADTIKEDDNFEVYSPNMEFLGSCGALFQFTSWSPRDLLTKSWDELFVRDHNAMKAIFFAIQRARETGKVIFDVCEPHDVVENKANGVRVIAGVRAIGPVFTENGKLGGFVGLTSLKPLLS